MITPKTELPKPNIDRTSKNKIKVKLYRYNRASINENSSVADATYKYVIHIRKLKRNGNQDKFFKLGKQILVYKSKNEFDLKNFDKGIYSIRFQVIITKGNKSRKTNWSRKTLIEI